MTRMESPNSESLAAARRGLMNMGFVVEHQVLAMQAAWIEWKHGDGAEAAMQWIENTLDGPDLLPRDEHGTDAQAFFDREIADSRRRQTEADATLNGESS